MKFFKIIAIITALFLSNTKSHSQPQNGYIVPVVFYIINDGTVSAFPITDLIVQKQLAALKNHYTGTGIDFCIATKVNGVPITQYNAVESPPYGFTNSQSYSVDLINVQTLSTGVYQLDISGQIVPGDRPSYSDWQELSKLSLLSTENFLRIFVIKDYGADGGAGSIPNIVPSVGNQYDLVWVAYDRFGDINSVPPTCGHCSSGSLLGKTLTHEVGHFLGLFHVFEDGCVGTGNPGDPCDDKGDYCCDTRPQTGSASSNCSTWTSCNGFLGNMANYMDYSDEGCQSEFTLEQIARMNFTLRSEAFYRFSGGRACLGTLCNQQLQGVQCITSPPSPLAPPAIGGQTITLEWTCLGQDIQLPYEPCGTNYNQTSGTPLSINSKGFIDGNTVVLPTGLSEEEYIVDVTSCGATNTYIFKVRDASSFYTNFTYVHNKECELGFPPLTYPDINVDYTLTPALLPGQSVHKIEWFRDWPNLPPPAFFTLMTTTYNTSQSIVVVGPDAPDCYDRLGLRQRVRMRVWFDEYCYKDHHHDLPCGCDLGDITGPGGGGTNPPGKMAPLDSNSTYSEMSHSIYPNPTNGRFNIELNPELKYNIVIYNISGTAILQENVVDKSLYNVNIENQLNGIYMVQIREDNNVLNTKVVKH